MAGRPPGREAPLFGQRLAAARRSRGWSQKELGRRLGTTQKMIDYYERHAINPSLEFIERGAQALGISATQLVADDSKPARNRPGPPPQLALRFEQIRHLPRKEQEFV